MFHRRIIRMGFCIALGFLMGAYLAKGFSQDNTPVVNPVAHSTANPIIESVKILEESFLSTSIHMLRLKHDQTYRENYSFQDESNIIEYIGKSNLQKKNIFSDLALNVGEKAISSFYGDALSSSAKSDAAVAERIQGFKDLCLEKEGHLLDTWDSSEPMNIFEDQWLFKPVFWYKGTGVGVDSGVVCLKSS